MVANANGFVLSEIVPVTFPVDWEKHSAAKEIKSSGKISLGRTLVIEGVLIKTIKV